MFTSVLDTRIWLSTPPRLAAASQATPTLVLPSSATAGRLEAEPNGRAKRPLPCLVQIFLLLMSFLLFLFSRCILKKSSRLRRQVDFYFRVLDGTTFSISLIIKKCQAPPFSSCSGHVHLTTCEMRNEERGMRPDDETRRLRDAMRCDEMNVQTEEMLSIPTLAADTFCCLELLSM